jgi:hypothetical protein
MLGDAREHAVRGLFERLVRERVRQELPRCVGVRPDEENEALTAQLHDRVLEPRGRLVATVQQPRDRPFVSFRLR